MMRVKAPFPRLSRGKGAFTRVPVVRMAYAERMFFQRGFFSRYSVQTFFGTHMRHESTISSRNSS